MKRCIGYNINLEDESVYLLNLDPLVHNPFKQSQTTDNTHNYL